MDFPVYDLPDAPDTDPEQMGTKIKFWFRHDTLGLCLWKQARENTGEDWAEKAVCEIAKCLTIPCAHYDLARWQDKNGVVSLPIVGVSHSSGREEYQLQDTSGDPGDAPIAFTLDADRLSVRRSLTHGNELLPEVLPDYPGQFAGEQRKYHNSDHTLHRVLQFMDAQNPSLPDSGSLPGGIVRAVEVFVGYLLLDALVGNTDRHHENWGFIQERDVRQLAPTYDHASSLGRNESDARRVQRLSSPNPAHGIASYALKGHSGFYAQVGDKKPLSTFEAFTNAATEFPNAARIWIGAVEQGATDARITEIFAAIPKSRISLPAGDFAQAMVRYNRVRLVDWAEQNL